MTIEVKQLVIKSSVSEGNSEGGSVQDGDSMADFETLKKELIIECKQIVKDSLSNQRER